MQTPSPLHFMRCVPCGLTLGYPRVICPRCGDHRFDVVESTGRGTVYSMTVVHTREESYGVCLVDLDEGVRVMAAGSPEIGAAVQLRVEEDRLCVG